MGPLAGHWRRREWLPAPYSFGYRGSSPIASAKTASDRRALGTNLVTFGFAALIDFLDGGRAEPFLLEFAGLRGDRILAWSAGAARAA